MRTFNVQISITGDLSKVFDESVAADSEQAAAKEALEQLLKKSPEVKPHHIWVGLPEVTRERALFHCRLDKQGIASPVAVPGGSYSGLLPRGG